MKSILSNLPSNVTLNFGTADTPMGSFTREDIATKSITHLKNEMMEKVLEAKEQQLENLNDEVRVRDHEVAELMAKIDAIKEEELERKMLITTLRHEIEFFRVWTKAEMAKNLAEEQGIEVAEENEDIKNKTDDHEHDDHHHDHVACGTIERLENKPEIVLEEKKIPGSTVEERRRNRLQRRKTKRRSRRQIENEKKVEQQVKQQVEMSDESESQMENSDKKEAQPQPSTSCNLMKDTIKTKLSTKDWAFLVENEVRALKLKYMESEESFHIQIKEKEEANQKLLNILQLIFKNLNKGTKKRNSGKKFRYYYFEMSDELKLAIRDLKKVCGPGKPEIEAASIATPSTSTSSLGGSGADISDHNEQGPIHDDDDDDEELSYKKYEASTAMNDVE